MHPCEDVSFAVAWPVTLHDRNRLPRVSELRRGDDPYDTCTEDGDVYLHVVFQRVEIRSRRRLYPNGLCSPSGEVVWNCRSCS